MTAFTKERLSMGDWEQVHFGFYGLCGWWLIDQWEKKKKEIIIIINRSDSPPVNE